MIEYFVNVWSCMPAPAKFPFIMAGVLLFVWAAGLPLYAVCYWRNWVDIRDESIGAAFPCGVFTGVAVLVVYAIYKLISCMICPSC